MAEHTADRYHAQPDEAFNCPPAAELPTDFAIVSTQPPPEPDFKQSGGRFVRGYDPRRHVFTYAERSKGFWTAIAAWGVGMGEKLHAAGRWPNYRRA